MKPNQFLDLYPAHLPDQRKLTEKHWAAFQMNPEASLSVRSNIYDSWQRSLRFGVSPSRGGTDVSITHSELEILIQRSELYEHAMPTLRFLSDQTKGTGHLVTLCDENGKIIFLDGDHEVQRSAENMNFVPGADWSENAIGTSIVVDNPIQVFAAEHFCQGVHDWACSAVPIHHPTTHKIVGVIDITGKWSRAQPHTLSLASFASRMIEDELYQQSVKVRYYLLDVFLKTTLRYPEDGVVILDTAFRIVEANPFAQRLWESKIHKSLKESWHNLAFHESLLKARKQSDHGDLYDIFMEELGIRASVQDVRALNRTIGYLLILKPHTSVRITDSTQLAGSWSNLIGCSSKIKAVVSKCDIAARTDVPILLLGETGSGKELVAKSIHDASPRRSKPFIPLNCGAIPKELLATELFGYESGSFTGASKNGKKGKFEDAQGGTIFLDEIGEMPLEYQVYLLRVLQEREVFRIGSSRAIPVDVRVIAATNRNLEDRVRSGEFRSDLYYRLNVVGVVLPSLRDRRDDIFLLIRYFLQATSKERHVPVPEIDPSVRHFLVYEYDWPGNVRELKNVLEYAILFCKSGTIRWSDVPAYLSKYQALDVNRKKYATKTQYSNDLSTAFKNESACTERENFDEKTKLVSLMERANGNVSEVSRQLGVARTTVYRRLYKYGVLSSQAGNGKAK